MIGHSMVPMPPITTTKMTKADQSRTVKPVSGETRCFQQPVLDQDRQAEGDDQRRQYVLAHGAVEDEALQQPAKGEHQRQRQHSREKRWKEQRTGENEDQIAAEQDEVAMGKVDRAHDAEGEAEPERKQRVKPAEQDALNDGVDPDHAAAPPK